MSDTPNPLVLFISDKVEFDVDKDDELCIEMDFDSRRAWLTRDEGQQLLDLLTRWLK